MHILVKTLAPLTSGLPLIPSLSFRLSRCCTVTAIGCNILAKYDCEEHVSHEISNIMKRAFILTVILSRVQAAGMLLSALSL